MSFGDPLTEIQVNCPFCGNKDTLYSWCDVRDVELEVNYLYGNMKTLKHGDYVVAKGKRYNVVLKVTRVARKYAFAYLWGQEIKLLKDFYGPIHCRSNISYEFRLATDNELNLIA